MNEGRRYILFLAAVAFVGICGAIWMVFFQTTLPIKHAETPYIHEISYKSYVYGNGTVIPSSEEIDILAPLQRRVVKVFVKEEDKVKKGDLLILLQNSDLKSAVAARKIALLKAKEQLRRLQELPRKEDLQIKEAAVKQAELIYREAERKKQVADQLYQQHAISEGEWIERNYLADLDKAKLEVAESELKQLQAGAWGPDVQIATMEVDHENALFKEEKDKLDETTIRAPLDGTILQVNIHPGEVALTSSSKPLIVMGNIEECHVEVAIDENEVYRFKPEASAIGYFRGKRMAPIPLVFVREEPKIVPKKNITGSTKEQIDVRVLNVIYRFQTPTKCPYVGQQMDVYIEEIK